MDAAADGDVTITGFEAGATPVGRHLYLVLYGLGSTGVRLMHQDTGSLSVNRFFNKDELDLESLDTAHSYHFIHTGEYWLHVGSN